MPIEAHLCHVFDWINYVPLHLNVTSADMRWRSPRLTIRESAYGACLKMEMTLITADIHRSCSAMHVF